MEGEFVFSLPELHSIVLLFSIKTAIKRLSNCILILSSFLLGLMQQMQQVIKLGRRETEVPLKAAVIETQLLQ